MEAAAALCTQAAAAKRVYAKERFWMEPAQKIERGKGKKGSAIVLCYFPFPLHTIQSLLLFLSGGLNGS